MRLRRLLILPAATAVVAAAPAPPTLAAERADEKPVTKASLRPVTYAKDLSREPIVPKQAGTRPADLIRKDLVVGQGRTARRGQRLVVQYTGYALSSGKKVDASWDRDAEPFSFDLGAGDVITGWDKGIAGMRVGGRRELVIPPRLAYGAAGSGPIGRNETLIFVVDLLKARP